MLICAAVGVAISELNGKDFAVGGLQNRHQIHESMRHPQPNGAVHTWFGRSTTPGTLARPDRQSRFRGIARTRGRAPSVTAAGDPIRGAWRCTLRAFGCAVCMEATAIRIVSPM